MNHYIDIKLLPDAELSETFLMNKVYAKLHKALDDLASDSIGVSFPQYSVLLGGVIRVHGNKESLEQLTALKWLARLADYCDSSPIRHVPDDIDGYRNVSRAQTNMSPSKLRRLLDRKTISPDEVKQYEEKMFRQGLKDPYVELDSSSNGNKYRRYFQFGKLSEEDVVGVFDNFGLSKTATVPWFDA